LRISRSCRDSSVSNAAAADCIVAFVLSSVELEADDDRLCKNSEYRVATFVSDPRVAPVPPPVRIRSLSVSLDREEGVGSAVLLDMVVVIVSLLIKTSQILILCNWVSLISNWDM